MPGVSITVEGDAIQGPRTAESEANGSYRVLNLPQGEYRVTYQKSRFKKIVYEGAKIEVNKTVTMNVTMPIADIEETVIGTNGSPIVDVAKRAAAGHGIFPRPHSARIWTRFSTRLLRNSAANTALATTRTVRRKTASGTASESA